MSVEVTNEEEQQKSQNVAVSDNLKEVYDGYYDDGLEEWRTICATQKVENIIELAQGESFDKVLELGAGSGILLQMLSKHNFAKHYYALDISESSIVQIKKKKIKGLESVACFDGYHIPYPDNHFDLVVLSHVLEHVEHPRMFIREVKRVCKAAIIEVPCDYKSGVDRKVKALTDYGHINVYTPTLLRFFLRTEGFATHRNKMSFSSNSTLLYRTIGLKRFRIKLFILVRTILYPLIPYWRKETMINAYTVFVKPQ